MWIVLLLSVFCLLLGLLPWAFAMLGAPGPDTTPSAALRVFLFGVGAGALLPAYLALCVSADEFWDRQARADRTLPKWVQLTLLLAAVPFCLWVRRNPSVAFAIVPAAGSFLLTYMLVLRFKYGDAG